MGGWIQRVAVTGTSMVPALQPGDRLLVRRTRYLRVGDLVVIRDPRQPAREVVKRVHAVARDAGVDVRGDAPGASTDSRSFGTVPWALVVGRVWYRYAPAERAGPVRSSSRSASP